MSRMCMARNGFPSLTRLVPGGPWLLQGGMPHIALLGGVDVCTVVLQSAFRSIRYHTEQPANYLLLPTKYLKLFC